MSLTSTNRTVQLLLRLLNTKAATEPIIRTEAQKPAVLQNRNGSSMPRSTPEKSLLFFGISQRIPPCACTVFCLQEMARSSVRKPLEPKISQSLA